MDEFNDIFPMYETKVKLVHSCHQHKLATIDMHEMVKSKFLHHGRDVLDSGLTIAEFSTVRVSIVPNWTLLNVSFRGCILLVEVGLTHDQLAAKHKLTCIHHMEPHTIETLHFGDWVEIFIKRAKEKRAGRIALPTALKVEKSSGSDNVPRQITERVPDAFKNVCPSPVLIRDMDIQM